MMRIMRIMRIMNSTPPNSPQEEAEEVLASLAGPAYAQQWATFTKELAVNVALSVGGETVRAVTVLAPLHHPTPALLDGPSG
jgi:hypothetical protein